MLALLFPKVKKVYRYLRMLECVLSHSATSDTLVTPWTVAHQAPLSVGFPRQEYQSGLPFPPPGGLPDPGTELYWQANSLALSYLGSPFKNKSCQIVTVQYFLKCRLILKIKDNEEALVCTGLIGFSYSFKEFDYSSVQGQNRRSEQYYHDSHLISQVTLTVTASTQKMQRFQYNIEGS